jgi:hypothetical protein
MPHKTPSCNRCSVVASSQPNYLVLPHGKSWRSSGTTISRDNNHAIKLMLTLLGRIAAERVADVKNCRVRAVETLMLDPKAPQRLASWRKTGEKAAPDGPRTICPPSPSSASGKAEPDTD